MSLSLPTEADQYWENTSEARLALLCTDPTRAGLLPSHLVARREALEAERRALKRVLCKIDTSLNDLKPVNSLPSDVLTHIFLIVMHSCWDPNERPISVFSFGSRPFSPKWLSLVRVCRRWRAEALACPSLWTRLATSMRPKMLTDFVQRSQDASLSLTTDRNRVRGTADHLDVVFDPAVMERIREATLAYGGLGSQPHIYLSKLAHSMPRLETFTYRHEPSAPGLPLSNTAPLPSNLFNGYAPRLRKLVLEMLPEIPQPCPFYNNLRVFCLNTSKNSNFAHPPSARLFELLEALPHLERLELIHTLPIEPFTPYSAAPLSRPHLKVLMLQGPILACTCMMRAISLTPNCSVSIDCDASGAPAETFAGLVDALASAGIKNITPHSLSAFSEIKGILRVAAYYEKFDDHFRDADYLYFPSDARALVLGSCSLLREVYCSGAPAYVLLNELATHEASDFLPGLGTLVFQEHRVSRHFLYEGVSLYDLLLHAIQRRPETRIRIDQQQPFLDEEDIAVLDHFTTLERFDQNHGQEIFMPPEHFFGFGPDWPGEGGMFMGPDAEMGEVEDAQEEFFDEEFLQ
ncbi:hypothetical protein PENSPDRAFT_266794 [Peniophora sp. CONT]|nr:hypothetical protein PENSPDRAFT_266794 [Peniophora sp. CONT]